MDVVITIDGRKAIPVRALPFVAGRHESGISYLSPDEVALVAAYPNGFNCRDPLDTFQIADGVARRVAHAQWPQFSIELEALSAKLKAEQRSQEEGRAKWKDEAIRRLPAGVFVWLEEFQAWFSRTVSLLGRGIAFDDEDGGSELRYESDELHLSPLVPLDLRDCIREGFEALFDASRPHERLTDALEGSFDKPLKHLSAWQRYRVRSDFFPMSWDELDEAQRRSVAAQWDCQHDPANEGVRHEEGNDVNLNARNWPEMKARLPIQYPKTPKEKTDTIRWYAQQEANATKKLPGAKFSKNEAAPRILEKLKAADMRGLRGHEYDRERSVGTVRKALNGWEPD